MNAAMRSTSALLAATTLSLGSCGDATPEGPTVAQRDSAGIRVIEVSGDLPALDWTFQSKLQIGGRDEGPESFYRVAPELVAAGPGGDIHVLDPIHHRIVTFSPDGEFLGSVGREGDGPSELRAPFALALSEEGDFVVADRGRSGLVRLTATGNARPAIPVEAPIFGASGVSIAGTTPVFTMFRWTTPSGGVESLLWGGSVRQLASVELHGPDNGGFTTCPGAWVGLPFLHRGLLWSATRAGVVVSPTLDYELHVFEQGELRAVIRRAMEREVATAAAIADEVGASYEARTGRGTCSVPIGEALRIKGYLPEVPAIAGLSRSPDGRIWVKRGTLPAAEASIDVFEADGTPVGTLPSGTPFPIVFTADGIGTSEEDDFGVQRLVVYEVLERR